MKKETTLKIICTLLVFLFVYAAISKLTDFAGFTIDMNNQPLPSFLKPILVWAVPATELGITALLIFDTTRLAGLYASFVLMVAFTFYTAVILLHSLNIFRAPVAESLKTFRGNSILCLISSLY